MTKDERREYMKKYRLANLDQINEQQKKYREKNKELIKERNKSRYEENKEFRLEYAKQYYIDNKEKRQEYMKAYRQNPDYMEKAEGYTSKWRTANRERYLASNRERCKKYRERKKNENNN